MKNIKLLSTQIMLKCTHNMFDEIDGKSIYLNNSVQEKVDGSKKEVEKVMLKLR